MSFCTFDSQYIMDTHTSVDNIFITEFLPEAPKSCIAVYLYGLYLAGNVQGGDNSMEIMSRVLNLTPDDIMDCFTYLEGFGLVSIIHKKPLEVKFRSTRSGKSIVKKINPGKYKDFNTQIQMQLPDRMIEPAEYNEYYTFLEQTFTEPEALVMIAKYCADLKGGNVGHHYILTVARNLAAAGYKTVETVEKKLENHSKLNPAIETILKALGTRRAVDYEDRALYQKWTEYGFSDETLLSVAKLCKNKGGIKKMDASLTEYYKHGLLTKKEIEGFLAEREQRYTLAKSINKIIGIYYESLDHIIETYISVWKGFGFSDKTLQDIAKYCFRHNIRTLEGMNTVVDKFHHMGLVTDEAIAQHIALLAKSDIFIKSLLEKLGLLRQVTAADRASYKVWQTWDFPDEVILHAASLSHSANNPLQYMNRILSDWKAKGIKTLDLARKEKKPASAPASVRSFPQHEYTKEQLDALFDDIDNLKF